MATKQTVAPWSRVLIASTSIVVMVLVAKFVTGEYLPSGARDQLIFQNALLLIVLGSALVEHQFTKPADSLINALMATITLVACYEASDKVWWWVITLYCASVFMLSLVCITISTDADIGGWQRRIADLTYRPAVFFGQARLLFSVVFLFAVFSFYGSNSVHAAILVVFWGAFVSVWPLGIPELLSAITLTRSRIQLSGRVIRTDAPNLVRVALDPKAAWEGHLKICSLADGTQRYVIPLYKQIQEDQLLGTGLLSDALEETRSGLDSGCVYDADGQGQLTTDQAVAQKLGGNKTSTLVGFVVEDSGIGAIRFETWRSDICREGMLVWCFVGSERVYYQITGGLTKEESLEADRHGFQVAEAAQLGTIAINAGFQKYTWLPTMNTPVFCETSEFGADINILRDRDFSFGTIPFSKIKIGGDFGKFWDHHTAIIGTTGSGKTELAFEMIRYATSQEIRVICIDLTGQYKGRLEGLGVVDLSITRERAGELGSKLFDVETGEYGAKTEKKALKEFANPLRGDVKKALEQFLGPLKDGKNAIGLITLEEISNTKATLYITELYLTCLLNYAKDSQGKSPRVLVVVEEAHTVMPEPTTMGLGDNDSKGLVSKIAQIALQGRKYRVGLLVIAQRTATVSKSVLTQCNTMITFTCFDETSLGFLSNIFSDRHKKLIPNLPRLQALVFGKALRSEQPIVIQIPHDPKKEGA